MDGKYATEGIDYRLYKDRGKDRGWEADTIETGVGLTEGIVLYRVPAVHFEPDTVWMAVIRNGRLVSNKPIEGEKNEELYNTKDGGFPSSAVENISR